MAVWIHLNEYVNNSFQIKIFGLSQVNQLSTASLDELSVNRRDRFQRECLGMALQKLF